MKQRKNITIDNQIWEMGKRQAKIYGLSFSGFIEMLIIESLKIL